MTTVLYPGSFDPFHNGHLELVETASFLFDRVVIAAVRNPQKGDGLFTMEERREMILDCVEELGNVEVVSFAKLVVDVAKDVGADFIIKGLRAPSDFESEMAQAQINLNVSGVHTLFLPSASANSFLASADTSATSSPGFGGDVSSMVPPKVAKHLATKVRHLKPGRS